MNFETLGIAPALLRALADSGYTTPTPIQAQAIPLVLSGEDVLGGAQTGTGKTAAFGLPLLQHLSKNTSAKGPRKPRALILVPTRELAVQVSDNLKGYSRYLRMNVTTLFGGAGMQPQINNLQRGVDVLVACPGRLLDHLERGTVKLDAIEMLVLDEADRMLDMGFLPAIKRVLARVPAQRQTLLFSATFEARIKALALEFMRNPKQVEVASQATIADTIVHRVHPVDASRKRDLLIDILSTRHSERVLVFGKTKHGCDRLCEQLEKAGLPAMAIHGNKSQGARQNALNRFKSGQTRILVATDVAARGLDIPDLPLVINHDLPMVAEDYVHRIGRTGRNGARGEALSLVAPDEGPLLRQIQRMLKTDIAMETVSGFEPSRAIRMDGPVSAARSGGNKPGGQHAPRKPAQRPHGHAHAKRQGHDAPKAGAHAARAGSPKPRSAQGVRRDRRA
ncbi:DEAD/DEAH box helicase [Solilutibacter silvestris]|uniref:DEAD-box ATP-dependent RNA helicase RhpA n=1 Tax=Solilutibacter silvestris TaxID=1645665 RepID=A0A2K1PY67_9GAMM|nr:DEAD/DEAH box helicase [Lysobacter silvestris]PNS07617.1 Superfamily II DNA and RNA helicase [Lysobacter silvestris]